MSPTSSSRPFAGRNALSATPRTNSLPSALRRLSARPSADRLRTAVLYPQTGTVERNLRLISTDAHPRDAPDPARGRVGAGMVAAGMGNSRGPASRCSSFPRWRSQARVAARSARMPTRRRVSSTSRSPTPRSRAKQRIAEATTLKLEVANRGDRAAPNLAVTVETEPTTAGQAPVAFAQQRQPGARGQRAARVDRRRGPAGGESAYIEHLGGRPARQGPDAHRRVEAHRAQGRALHGRLAARAGARRRLRAGGRPHEGQFVVTIEDEPVPARVDGGASRPRRGSRQLTPAQ